MTALRLIISETLSPLIWLTRHWQDVASLIAGTLIMLAIAATFATGGYVWLWIWQM